MFKNLSHGIYQNVTKNLILISQGIRTVSD